MMFRKKIRVITQGGLGDILLSTPSFRALKEKYPDRKIVVHCVKPKHREIYKNNPYVDEVRGASFWSAPLPFILYAFRRIKIYSMDYGYLMPSICYKKNATEIIAEMMGVHLKEKNIQVFLSEKEETDAKRFVSKYKNPVTLHVRSLTSANQEWPVSNWEELIRRMPDCTFIQLGMPGDPPVKGALDTRGALPFRDAMAVIKYSRSFVGVSSSFSHATNAFGVPGVVLLGPSSPEVWGHSNNINLYKNLRCAPCLDLLLSSDCPYGCPCMKGITVEEVRAALMAQLESKKINNQY